MREANLRDIREYIESLASDDGRYYVVCGRTDDRPVPADGLTFESRAVARTAARATKRYRATLRTYDHRTPEYDLVVRERSEKAEKPDEWTLADPVLTGARPSGRQRVVFCHRVAAAVFETLDSAGYDTVEATIMDRYFELATTVGDPDELCLRLLESLAFNLATALSPGAQAEVISEAASHLEPGGTNRPMKAALMDLRCRGIVGQFSCAPATIDRGNEMRSVVATLGEYALRTRQDRLPVLPLLVALYRHQPRWSPSAVRANETASGWRLTVEFGTEADHRGFSTAPRVHRGITT